MFFCTWKESIPWRVIFQTDSKLLKQQFPDDSRKKTESETKILIHPKSMFVSLFWLLMFGDLFMYKSRNKNKQARLRLIQGKEIERFKPVKDTRSSVKKTSNVCCYTFGSGKNVASKWIKLPRSIGKCPRIAKTECHIPSSEVSTSLTYQ